MKQKLKKINLLITIFLAGILLFSCQKEDELQLENQQENLKFAKRNLDDLFKEDHFVKAFQKLPKKKKNVSNHLSKTIMEEQYGFTILGNAANEVITDSTTSYTLRIRKNDTNHLENLIVQVNNYNPNDIKAFVFEYLNPYTEHYTGDVKVTPIVYNANQVSTSRVKYECTTVVFPCVNHPFGGDGCWGPTTKTYCYYVDVDGAGGGGGDTGSGGDTSSGSGTTGGANSSGSTSDPVAPPPTENHTPVYTVPVAEATDPKTDKLKSLMNSKVKSEITNLKYGLNSIWEKCFSVLEESSTGSIGIANAINRGENHAIYPFNNFVIGGYHNHPFVAAGESGSGYPMFSPGDLGILFHINRVHPSTAVEPKFMFNGLVVDGKIYAIVPNNPSLLSNLATKFQNRTTIRMFNEEIDEIYEKIGTNKQEELAQAFLKFVNDKYNLDISLYQMDINDLYLTTNTWTEIKKLP